ncbi:MAG: hypothetical protein H6R19_3486 [Proteobacteria bacterium]|nr:hypothetical protein [Pseudomonadota bacterium]
MPLTDKNKAVSRGIWAVTTFILVTTWVSVFIFSDVYKTGLVDGKRQELIQMNSVVAQHTAALFKTIETDLSVIALWLQTTHSKDPVSDPTFIELVKRLKQNSESLVDIRLISTTGKAYAVPVLADTPVVDIEDRDYFYESPAGENSQIHISDPIVGRITGKWLMPVHLHLKPEVAGFRMVLAVINISKLVAIQKNWIIGSHGSIVLLHDDGTLLSRAPHKEGLIGQNFKETPGYQERKKYLKGCYISDGKNADGVKRIISYERLDKFNLFVSVSRGYDEALQTFYRLRQDVFFGAGILTLCVLGAVLAIQRAQNTLLRVQQDYQSLALIDDLTKVMNRRAFMANAELELTLTKERGGSLAVLMIDIDHFKRINDQSGHAAGDEILKSATQLWRAALRRDDILGRLGGEEFGVILPAADMPLAIDIANRLRSLTAEQTSIGTVKGPLTVSIGVSVGGKDEDNIRDLLRQADEALYRAKENGRNRVELYAPTA